MFFRVYRAYYGLTISVYYFGCVLGLASFDRPMVSKNGVFEGFCVALRGSGGIMGFLDA